MERTPRTVDAVETACELLDVLEEHREAGVTDLARELDVNKSTVYNHLSTLRKRHYVVKEGRSYRLSLRSLSMAETVKQQIGPHDTIVEELDGLVAETGEVAQFAVEEQNRLVYVYKMEGEDAVPVATGVGYVGEKGTFHSTGLGKAILAHLPGERVTEILEQEGMARFTENTITDRDALERELAAIRERGYAVDDGESYTGLRCVAAPVTRDDGEVLGAVSVSGPASRMNDERIESELSTLVVGAANVIDLNTSIPR